MGMGDGEEYGVSPGGDGDVPSEAAKEVASLSEPELLSSTEKSPMELIGEALLGGPGDRADSGSGSGGMSWGAAAGRSGPGRAGAGPRRGGRRRLGVLGPG